MYKISVARGAAKLILPLLLAVTLLLPELLLIAAAADSADLPQSSAPEANNCVVYHYAEADSLTPTLYIWGISVDAAYRVYSSNFSTAALIGTGIRQPSINGCAIPLDSSYLDPYSGGYVYLSRQVDGEAESERVAIPYDPAVTPSVSFSVKSINKANIKNGVEAVKTTMTLNTAGSPARLSVGNYYVVDVLLNNFTTIQSLALPIKYDPAVFELTSLTFNANLSAPGYVISGAVSAPNGAYIPAFDTGASIVNGTTYNGATVSKTYVVGGNAAYGIGIYDNLYYWGAEQSTNSSSSLAQTPYVNTSTGLIKLELNSKYPVDISSAGTGNGFATASNSRKILRLFFKCIAAPDATDTSWASSDIIRFATKDDIPAGVTSSSEQQKYYYTTAPDGYLASLQAFDILKPPAYVQTLGDVYAADAPLLLTADQIYSLPNSLSSADQIRTLLENQVKIYNYTNYFDDGIDRDFSKAEDTLLLTPSSGTAGAAQQEDLISVYSADKIRIKAPVSVNSEGGIAINLGNDLLDPDGGFLYVSLTRNGVESDLVAVPYSQEMTRNVFFRVFSNH